MTRIGSSKRYAQAAFELALERNELESWQEGLAKIARLTGEEDLMALLRNPRLPLDAKKTLLQERLEKVNPLAFNLALLLVSKGIFGEIGDISQQYHLLLDAHSGIERARVTTALSLSDEERKAISHRLGEIVRRKVKVEDETDPSIIGGFIARIGDKLIDGSIRQRLEALKKNLAEAGR